MSPTKKKKRAFAFCVSFLFNFVFFFDFSEYDEYSASGDVVYDTKFHLKNSFPMNCLKLMFLNFVFLISSELNESFWILLIEIWIMCRIDDCVRSIVECKRTWNNFITSSESSEFRFKFVAFYFIQKTFFVLKNSKKKSAENDK